MARLTQNTFSLAPHNLTEAIEFAKLLANSSVVPKPFQGKPGDILVAIQMGSELGLQPMQALQNITVLNGRPCLWGDAMLAVVKAHPDFEYIKEYEEESIAVCKLKRKNQPEHTSTFSSEDAKTAGLLHKAGPWTQYPKRMRQMRARSFALRDVFPDALRGLQMVEEVQDIPTEESVATATPSSMESLKMKLGVSEQPELAAPEISPATHSITDENPHQEEAIVIQEKMQSANSPQELRAAAELAKHLSDAEEKSRLRKIYKEKLAFIKKTVAEQQKKPRTGTATSKSKSDIETAKNL